MIDSHAAACGRSDVDPKAEIKERVEPTSWDHGPLIAHYVASSEPLMLLKRNGWSGYQARILL